MALNLIPDGYYYVAFEYFEAATISISICRQFDIFTGKPHIFDSGGPITACKTI